MCAVIVAPALKYNLPSPFTALSTPCAVALVPAQRIDAMFRWELGSYIAISVSMSVFAAETREE